MLQIFLWVIRKILTKLMTVLLSDDTDTEDNLESDVLSNLKSWGTYWQHK